MSHWIEQKAEQTQSQKDDVQKRRVQGLEIICNLEAAVRADVDKWNELNSSYRRRIDGVFKTVPTGAFQIRKVSFPSAAVDVMLAPDAWSIQVRRNNVDPAKNLPQITREQFELKAGSKGTLVLSLPSGESVSLGMASRFLLEPIIEAIGKSR